MLCNVWEDKNEPELVELSLDCYGKKVIYYRATIALLNYQQKKTRRNPRPFLSKQAAAIFGLTKSKDPFRSAPRNLLK